MGLIALPQRFLTQPQYAAPIDREGLGKGVQLLFNPALGPIDLATGRVWDQVNSTTVISQHGRAFNFDGSNDYLAYSGYPELTSNVGTFFMWCPRVGAASSFGHIYLVAESSPLTWYQIDDASKAWVLGSQSAQAISWFNTTNRSLVFVSGGTAASCKLYVDGIDSGLTWSGAPVAFVAGNKNFRVGMYSTSNAWDTDASMLSVGLTGAVWGAAEAKAFHDSKGFALFKAPSRRLWVVGGSSGVSGAVAYTNANDTLAGSGTTTVKGTLAKTNASDTSAASGTTTVTGTLAKTNANDSVSASGSVGSAVSGTLAYTNANDTAAASGTTKIVGSLARTNANDTVSASGTTAVTGSLAKTNANDSSAASGTTTIVGSLAKTNANDSISASGTVTSGSSGTVAYTNKNDTSAASGTTKIVGSLAKTNANDSLAASGTVNNGIIVEAALTDGITAAIRIKKPGVPTGTPDWLKTTIEIVLGRRGNKITIPAEQTLTFSATPTKAECEALYQYTNTVRTAVSDLINRLDS